MPRLTWGVVVLLVVSLSFAAVVVTASPARAQQDSSGFPSITFEYYTYGGQQYELGCGGSDCPAIPTGATVDIRVWVDIYNCDPVTIYFGAQGAGSETVYYDGAFSMDFQHLYSEAGIYPVKAVMPTCPGSYDDVAPLTIGGSGSSAGGGLFGFSGPYDDSGLYPIAVPALLFALIALAIAASASSVGTAGAAGTAQGGGRVGKRGAPPPPVPDSGYIPFTQPHLDGMPFMESTNWASLLDIPPGARRIDPGRIPFVPGTPTDIGQAPMCPDGCGPLVYTVAGWFCPNPQCPEINTGQGLTAFPKVGEFYG
jgi:hypothetical protein